MNAPSSPPDQDTPVQIHLIDQDSAHLLDHLDPDVFDAAVRPELLAAFLANPANQLVVAVVAGEVVGMASGIAYVHPDKPLSLFINEVGVSERLHRRGIGRQLLAALLARARDLGCREAWVATESDNLRARAFYRGIGAEEEPEPAVVFLFPDLAEAGKPGSGPISASAGPADA